MLCLETDTDVLSEPTPSRVSDATTGDEFVTDDGIVSVSHAVNVDLAALFNDKQELRRSQARLRKRRRRLQYKENGKRRRTGGGEEETTVESKGEESHLTMCVQPIVGYVVHGDYSFARGAFVVA